MMNYKNPNYKLKRTKKLFRNLIKSIFLIKRSIEWKNYKN